MATYIIGTLIFLAFCYAIYRTFFSKGKSCCGGCSGLSLIHISEPTRP